MLAHGLSLTGGHTAVWMPGQAKDFAKSLICYGDALDYFLSLPVALSACPLWVASGHLRCKTYPRKRTCPAPTHR